jgi:hypothetical protein
MGMRGHCDGDYTSFEAKELASLESKKTVKTLDRPVIRA